MTEAKTKTVMSIDKPSPKWLTYAFRISFLVTGAIIVAISADPAIPDGLKVRIGVYAQLLNTVLWGMGRIFGVEIVKPDTDKPSL